jgi:hypothetical protein
LDLSDLSQVLREGLLAMAVPIGLKVMKMMMEKEIEELIGPKGSHIRNRLGN